MYSQYIGSRLIFGFLEDINKCYLSKFKIDQFDISTEVHVELFELKADLKKAKKKKSKGASKECSTDG
jgi:hypothetical protein